MKPRISSGNRSQAGRRPATGGGPAAADNRDLRVPEQVRISGQIERGRWIAAGAQQGRIVGAMPADEVVRGLVEPFQIGLEASLVRSIERGEAALRKRRLAPGAWPGGQDGHGAAESVEQRAQRDRGGTAAQKDQQGAGVFHLPNMIAAPEGAAL